MKEGKRDRRCGRVLANQKGKHRGGRNKEFLFLVSLSDVSVIKVVILIPPLPSLSPSLYPCPASCPPRFQQSPQCGKLLENFGDSSNLNTYNVARVGATPNLPQWVCRSLSFRTWTTEIKKIVEFINQLYENFFILIEIRRFVRLDCKHIKIYYTISNASILSTHFCFTN